MDFGSSVVEKTSSTERGQISCCMSSVKSNQSIRKNNFAFLRRLLTETHEKEIPRGQAACG